MSRKTYAIALTVLTLALFLVPGVHAWNPIANLVVEDLPPLVAGSTYEMKATFDNIAKDDLPLVVDITVTFEDEAALGVIIEEIKLNDDGVFFKEIEEIALGVFRTEMGTLDAKSSNELLITVSTLVNLMPGVYNFEIELWTEAEPPPPPPNKNPVADAGSDQTVYVGEVVYFSGEDSYDPDGRIVSYAWDFGDGTTATGVEADHKYTESGPYTVTLVVKDNRGAVGTDTCAVTVTEAPPEMGTLSISTTPVDGEVFVNEESWGTAPAPRAVEVGAYDVSFGEVSGYLTPDTVEVEVEADETTEVTGTYTVIPPDMGVLSVNTEPVKGEVFVNKEPWGTAPQTKTVKPGTYSVSFGAVAGYVTPESVDAVVEPSLTTEVLGIYTEISENQPPVADAGGPYYCDRYEIILLDGSGSHDPDGSLKSWTWDFGDDTTGTGVKPSHIYTEYGIYTVVLTVTDNDGLTDSDSTTVTVSTPPPISPPVSMGSANKKPVADAGPDQTVYVDETVIFDGSGSYDPDGSLKSWTWDFGDGEKASGETASHTYSEPDVYTVTLTVKDYRSAEVSDTCIVTVTEETEPTPPLKPAEFEISKLKIEPDEVEPGEEVTITFTVANVGEMKGTCTVNLSIEGEPRTIVVTLDRGESEEVEFKLTPEADGTYRVEVDGLSDTFEVSTPPIPLKPAEFEISALVVSPGTVVEGEQVTVTVNVENKGEEEGTHTVLLEVDGRVTELTEITLEGGESTIVTFNIMEAAGDYAVGVEGLEGSFTVTSPLTAPLWMRPGYVAGILILILIAGTTTYTLYRSGRLTLTKSTPGP